MFEEGLENPSEQSSIEPSEKRHQNDSKLNEDEQMPYEESRFKDSKDEEIARDQERPDHKIGDIEKPYVYEFQHTDPGNFTIKFLNLLFKEDSVSTSAPSLDFHKSTGRSLPSISKSSLPENLQNEVSSTTFNDDLSVDQQASFITTESKVF